MHVHVHGSREGYRLARWSALDAILLKTMAMELRKIWGQTVERRCHHIKGYDGLKGAVNVIDSQGLSILTFNINICILRSNRKYL